MNRPSKRGRPRPQPVRTPGSFVERDRSPLWLPAGTPALRFTATVQGRRAKAAPRRHPAHFVRDFQGSETVR